MASFHNYLFKSKNSQPSTSAKHPTPSHPSKNHQPQFPDSTNSALRRSASCKPAISSSSTAAPPPLTKRSGASAAADKVVVYFTSLRGIRRTYEDCCVVRSILAGFWVLVDERDVSMDAAYRRELQSLLSQPAVALPQVFVRGKHMGGAEEVRMLHETGELAKILEGLPLRNPGLGCKHCGNARFVLCGNCDGSRKVFVEEEGRLRRCPECNEHGLVRCEFCL
ncbi:hypothetical protein ACLOJK_024688 [Asimina triloba]